MFGVLSLGVLEFFCIVGVEWNQWMVKFDPLIEIGAVVCHFLVLYY